MNKNNFKKKVIILLIILLITITISLFCGSSKLTIRDCLEGLFTNNQNTNAIIMKNIRLPRIVSALIAGVGLSASGIILQSITDNNLASPNIIGVNSGAGLFTIVFIFFCPTLFIVTPFIAFIGAFLTTLIILLISNKINSSHSTIILAGIAITTLFNGIISLITLIDNDILSMYKYFSIGGLNGITFKQLIIPIILIIITLIISILFSKKIEISSLGDELSRSLGVNPIIIKIITMLCASCLAAAVVSFAGLLGFVGLIVPHISRKVIRGNLKQNLIGAVIIGSILVLVADTLGRCIIYPTEIPVGIVMSFIGCPFFLYLLLRRKKYVKD